MLLIVGAHSEIGAAALHLAASQGKAVLSTTRQQPEGPDQIHLDLREPVDRLSLPDGVTAACIFAAIARLGACAADPKTSAFINVAQTLALADRLTARGIYTLFLSSNQVFDGDRAHMPTDAPLSPKSEYGRQKAEAERALRMRMAEGAPIGILRLAKVVSPGMTLLRGWRSELAAKRRVRAFRDMNLAPVPIEMAALSVLHLMEDRRGVVAQLGGPRDVSYVELARALAQEIGADPGFVDPVSARDAGMPPGSTPRHTTLDSSYVASSYDLIVPDVLELMAAL